MALHWIGLFIVGLLGIAFQVRGGKRFEGIGSLFLLAVVGATLDSVCDASGQKMIYFTLAMTGMNFVLSRFDRLRSNILRNIVPVLSTILLFLMFKDETIGYLDAKYPIVNKFIILSSIVAVFGIEIALLKFKIIALSKFDKALDKAKDQMIT